MLNNVVDIHNRYEIAQAHGLEFATTEMQFATRDDVIIWIIKNQLGRRNLIPAVRISLAEKLKPVIAAKAKENQQLSEGRGQKGCQISDNLNIDTKKEIAKAAGVSHDTIAKFEKIDAEASPEIKAAVMSGELKINTAYEGVKAGALAFAKICRKKSKIPCRFFLPPCQAVYTSPIEFALAGGGRQ